LETKHIYHRKPLSQVDSKFDTYLVKHTSGIELRHVGNSKLWYDTTHNFQISVRQLVILSNAKAVFMLDCTLHELFIFLIQIWRRCNWSSGSYTGRLYDWNVVGTVVQMAFSTLFRSAAITCPFLHKRGSDKYFKENVSSRLMW